MKYSRLFLLLLISCCGCASTEVCYRVSFTHEGQTVGVTMRNDSVECSLDLTK